MCVSITNLSYYGVCVSITNLSYYGVCVSIATLDRSLFWSVAVSTMESVEREGLQPSGG